MFGNVIDKAGDECFQIFLSMLSHAPDKRKFLGDFYDRLYPQSGSGSIADVLIRRKAQVMKLAVHDDEQVRAWAAESMPLLDRWIENARELDRASEESFE